MCKRGITKNNSMRVAFQSIIYMNNCTETQNDWGFSLGGRPIGGFLTIGYCLRAIGYCFPIVSMNFVREQGLDGGGQSCDGGSPSPPH